MIELIREEAVCYLRSMARQNRLKETARSIGMSYHTLAAYTKGSRRPGVDALAKIAAHLAREEG